MSFKMNDGFLQKCKGFTGYIVFIILMYIKSFQILV